MLVSLLYSAIYMCMSIIIIDQCQSWWRDQLCTAEPKVAVSVYLQSIKQILPLTLQLPFTSALSHFKTEALFFIHIGFSKTLRAIVCYLTCK